VKITAAGRTQKLQTLECRDNFVNIFIQPDSSKNGVCAQAHLPSRGAMKT